MWWAIVVSLYVLVGIGFAYGARQKDPAAGRKIDPLDWVGLTVTGALWFVFAIIGVGCAIYNWLYEM